MNKIKWLLSTSIFICVLITLKVMAQTTHNHNDAPSVHGMLLFGNEKVYLSHLPMFHSPHDYQAILEVSLEGSAKKIFLDSKKNNLEESVFTIVPEVFVLPDVVDNKSSFKATIFLGHFERGGVPITGSIDIKINEVIYFNKLNGNAPKHEQLKYIYFGNKKEIFAAHLISSKPDFDHIVKVSNTLQLDQFLAEHSYIEVDYQGISNKSPLEAGMELLGSFKKGNEAFMLDKHLVAEELYLEFNDLSF